MADIILSNHAILRLIDRGIDVHEAKMIAKNGHTKDIKIDGSIVKTGICGNGKKLVVICTQQGSRLIIKTAYYEN